MAQVDDNDEEDDVVVDIGDSGGFDDDETSRQVGRHLSTSSTLWKCLTPHRTI